MCLLCMCGNYGSVKQRQSKNPHDTTIPPYMNDRQYHNHIDAVISPCIITWLPTTLIDVYCCPCCCVLFTLFASAVGCFCCWCTVHSGLIDSNSVNCRLTIYQPSIPYGADCRAFVHICCCVPYSSTFFQKRLVCCGLLRMMHIWSDWCRSRILHKNLWPG